MLADVPHFSWHQQISVPEILAVSFVDADHLFELIWRIGVMSFSYHAARDLAHPRLALAELARPAARMYKACLPASCFHQLQAMGHTWR